MTDAQKWYLELLAAQHLGTDDLDQVNSFVTQQTLDDPSVPNVSKIIDRLRMNLPEGGAPTPRLRDAILRTARKGNANDLCSTNEVLIPKLEREQGFAWDRLDVREAFRVLDAYRQKLSWGRGYKNRYVHGRY